LQIFVSKKNCSLYRQTGERSGAIVHRHVAQSMRNQKKETHSHKKIPTLAFFGLQNEVGKVSPKKKTENRASKSARITHNQFHNFIQDQLLV